VKPSLIASEGLISPERRPQPIRVADPDDRVRALAHASLDADGAVVDLNPPGSAAVADQLIGHVNV